jgi:hypothetical protein
MRLGRGQREGGRRGEGVDGEGGGGEGGTKGSFDLSLLYTVSDPFFNLTYNKMYQWQGRFSFDI